MYVSWLIMCISISAVGKLKGLIWNSIHCSSLHRRYLASTSRTQFSNCNSEDDSRWVEPGHVYIVATPIGNLADITDRAKAVLREVDVIFAEDTRNTHSLLKKLNISYKRLLSHHHYNEASSSDYIIQLAKGTSLDQGGLQSIAIVSDAGTPGISDPGQFVIQKLIDQKIPVVSVPGACAFLSALVLSGLPTERFSFLGFLPVKGPGRQHSLRHIYEILISHTIILYEAPHRLIATLRDLLLLMDEDTTDCMVPAQVTTRTSPPSPRRTRREIVLCRELTKRHEEIIRAESVEAMVRLVEERQKDATASLSLKGEFVIVLGPAVMVAQPHQTAAAAAGSIANNNDPMTQSIVQEVEEDGESERIRSLLLRHRDEGRLLRTQAIAAVYTQLQAEQRRSAALLLPGGSSKGKKKEGKIAVTVKKSAVYGIALQIEGWPQQEQSE